MTETILITGASGFVGKALVRGLLASGRAPGSIRCLVRRRASPAPPGEEEPACVLGDLHDPDSLLRAAEGVATCIHLAGTIKALSAAQYLRSNATGTESLVKALERRSPGCRLVHVSSLAAAGPSVDGSTSSAPPDRCRPPSWYGESKRRGELAVVASRLRWIIVRPPIIYGPADSASGFLVRQALAPLCAVPCRPRPISLIHVDDVVRALLLAARSDLHSVVLPLDGPQRLDSDSLMRTIGEACGKKTRLVRTPLWLARCAALPVEAYARVVRRPGIFSLDKLREVAAAGWIADPEPARKGLGFVAERMPREGFAGVARSIGLLPESLPESLPERAS